MHVVWTYISSFKLVCFIRTICCLEVWLVAWQDIAVVAQSESKWKQLGELAMSDGMVTVTAIN